MKVAADGIVQLVIRMLGDTAVFIRLNVIQGWFERAQRQCDY